MKKTITIIALILAITVSLIAGTMSYYTVTLDNLASGSVVAKSFSLTGEGSDNFEEALKIAPGESHEWVFSFDASSETGMDVDVDIQLLAADGKSMITPLLVTVKENNAVVTGPLQYQQTAGQGLHKAFTVEVTWPWGTPDNGDIAFQGDTFGASLTVTVTGKQVQR